MTVLTWHEVDFGGVVVAGLIGGYLMAIAGLWAGKVPGLTSFDIADFGRRYIVSDRPSAWYFGMVSHLANSVIFVLVWAAVIYPNLPWPGVLKGLLWGEVLALFLSGGLIAPMSGIGIMGRHTGSLRFALTSVILHAIWGISIGVLYTPWTPR